MRMMALALLILSIPAAGFGLLDEGTPRLGPTSNQVGRSAHDPACCGPSSRERAPSPSSQASCCGTQRSMSAEAAADDVMCHQAEPGRSAHVCRCGISRRPSVPVPGPTRPQSPSPDRHSTSNQLRLMLLSDGLVRSTDIVHAGHPLGSGLSAARVSFRSHPVTDARLKALVFATLGSWLT